MKRFLYALGRALQVAALAAMPTSMWVAHFGRNEAGSIGIFVGSIAVFAGGYFLTRLSARV